jgi:hypothetical protein
MRASPAFRVAVARFGIWRAAVATLVFVAVVAQAAWSGGRHDDVPGWGSVVLAAVDLALIGAAAGLLRQRVTELRWDTRRWHLRPAAHAVDEPTPGNLTIALDLGVWMLLKFDPDPALPTRRTTWLPVQRQGLEADWHALRCAVYCARPALGTDADPNLGVSPESQE